MAKSLILVCFAMVLAWGQERTTAPRLAKSSAEAVSYQPDDVEILGDLNYGQSSGWVNCNANPRYHAFVFSGYGGDRVAINVQSKTGKAWVALADSTLNRIAIGSPQFTISLPYRGPDIEVWYILFREADNRPAPFSVRVNKLRSGAEKTSANGVTGQ